MKLAIEIFLCLVLSSMPAVLSENDPPFQSWSLEQSIRLLNESPWARQETFTRVVGGIGSGIRGEKEIYNTFFVRFLSARPIREAYARINQLQLDYDSLDQEERERVNAEIERGLELDVRRWVVVTVSFRSNNPSEEDRVEQFFRVQTTETMRSRSFLSTQHFPKLELVAYFPPRAEWVGAKFVFPRRQAGREVVSPEDRTVSFELETPGADPRLRVTFQVKPMIRDGKLVL